MKNKNSYGMWQNALTHTDEKYIAEAAELAPESETTGISLADKKHGTGNLGFVFAAAAAVLVSFIGVGFFLKGTGIEPLSPSAGSIGASNDEPTAPVTGISENGTMTTTIVVNENGEIITGVSRSDAMETTTEEITTVSKQPLTMEKLKALVSAKGKELTWSDFEQFEGKDVGSGLYIMEYPINAAFKLVVGGVPTEKPLYIRLIYNTDESVFSISDNGADGFEEFIENTGYRYDLEDRIIYDENNPTIITGYDYYGQNTHVNLVIPEGVTEIGEYAFAEAKIKKITLPESLTKIGDYAFYMSTLEEIVIPSGVKEIGYSSFDRCLNLEKVTLNNGLEKIGERSFMLCSMLSDIEIPDTVTEIGGEAFMGTGLYSVTIPASVASLGSGAFSNCIMLENVSFEGSMKDIPEFCFSGCTSLRSVKLPGDLRAIYAGAFSYCTSLDMILPDTVKTISDGAFEGCTQFDGTFKPSSINPVIRTTDIIVRTQGVEGEFIFEYYIDDVLQENMTETRKISGADEIKWSVEGYGIHKYVLEVTSVATNASGILYTMEVDFTTDPPTIEHNDTFDSMLFRKLLGSDFTLIRPVDSTFITTEYSEGEGGHDGIDYAGKLGDNIYAAADGIVTTVETDYDDKGCGKYVIIDHGNGYTTCYAHLDSISVEMFAEVSQGDVIGGMGSTGWSTGPHLHFTLAKNGSPVDPHIYLDDPIQLIHPTGDVYPDDDILYGYGEYEGHKGIDYGGEKGQYVVAAANGTVSFAGWNEGYGNCVIIDHRNGYQTIYAHLDEIKVKAGDTVTTGHLIGTMGSTGVTTGVHLHFELLKDGDNLNPADYIN